MIDLACGIFHVEKNANDMGTYFVGELDIWWRMMCGFCWKTQKIDLSGIHVVFIDRNTLRGLSTLWYDVYGMMYGMMSMVWCMV